MKYYNTNQGSTKLILEYLIILIPGISLGSIILLIYFLRILWRVYRKYYFFLLKLKLIQVILDIFAILFNLLALFCCCMRGSLILYSLGLISLVLILDIEAVFLNYLRKMSISKILLSVLFLITISKSIALIIHPFQITVIEGLMIRKAHLYPLSMLISTILIIIVWLEFIAMLKVVPKHASKRKVGVELFLLYSTALLLPFLFVIGTQNELVQVIIPYIETLMTGVVFFLVIYIYIDNPEAIYLLPVNLYGVLLSTFNGVSIYENCLRRKYCKAISLARSIILSLLTTDQPRERELHGIVRVFEFAEFKVIVYISYFIVGVFIANITNTVLINILKNITNEYEQIIKYPGESILSDEERDVAERIVEKYRMPALFPSFVDLVYG